MIRLITVLALLPALAAAQESPTAFDCLAEDDRAFRVELWQPSELGGPVHCVVGIDLDGVAGCAPQGGWGLSDPANPGVLTTTDNLGTFGEISAGLNYRRIFEADGVLRELSASIRGDLTVSDRVFGTRLTGQMRLQF